MALRLEALYTKDLHVRLPTVGTIGPIVERDVRAGKGNVHQTFARIVR